MSSGRIAQHRNYADVMARHERDIRLKRVFRAFVYFLIIAFLLILFFFFKRWEARESAGKPVAYTRIGETIKNADSPNSSTTRPNNIADNYSFHPQVPKTISP